MSSYSNYDDDRLINQHESAKATVEHDLNAEISHRAEEVVHKDKAVLDDMAVQVKNKAVADVQKAARLSERRQRLARTVQVIDFLFYALYVLLAVRLILGMIAARSDAGFVKFITTVTDPFYAFFKGIVQSPSASGGYTIVLPILIAMGAYALLHWGVRSLAKLIAYRQSEI
ncbi:MAG: YggT family protein [Fimbriimonadaceae bacterium]|nr:YggT family protein [Fimbriimonadaceae bacterium]